MSKRTAAGKQLSKSSKAPRQKPPHAASGGGAATALGMEFQHRTGAWLAVRILAEDDSSTVFGISGGGLPVAFQCETSDPVDDLLMHTSAGGCAFVQVKHALSCEVAADSDLASVLKQFVLQFIAGAPMTPTSSVPRRCLNVSLDRLVLVTGAGTSALIRRHLPAVLSRLPSKSLHKAWVNQDEKKAISVTLTHLKTAWKAATGSLPTETEIRAVLALIQIQVLALEAGGTDEDGARNLLRHILRNPWQSDAAWESLINTCSVFASNHSGADRLHLQQILINHGFALKPARSYREDVECLRQYSKRLLGLYADFARVQVGAIDIKINRRATAELRRCAEDNSLLLTGQAGAGKSGTLYGLIEHLEMEGRDYIFFAVDRVDARTLGGLRGDLGLVHELTDVMANWPGMQPAFLIIDALDAARGAPAERSFRDLIQLVAGMNSRWRVIASIRQFDLRYSPELRQLFTGRTTISLSPDLQDSEFGTIRHLNVPCLIDEELAQVAPLSAELHTIITKAEPVLYQLLRVPFNLRLMALLLMDGVSPSDMGPIRSQVELLDRYWLSRITHSRGNSHAREQVLRFTCEEMVSRRMLRAPTSRITGFGFTDTLLELQRDNVLSEWHPPKQASPDRSVLTFAHHVLFDYAVERLVLRTEPQGLIRRLAEERDLALLIRPSLVFHFQYLWMLEADHRQFWDFLCQIVREPGIPQITKVVGPSVVVESARHISDFERLILAVEGPDDEVRTTAEVVLNHMMRSVMADPNVESSLAGAAAGPWSDFVERVSRNLTMSVSSCILPIVSLMSQHPGRLTPPQLCAVGKSARRLLTFAWGQTERNTSLLRFSIESVCLTFESDSESSSMVLRHALAHAHMAAYAFEEMYWLAKHLKRVISLSPGFVTEVYDAAFKHTESSDAITPLGCSQILPMSSTRKQDFHMAQHVLAEIYPEFIARAPAHATRVLIGVLESYVKQRHSHGSETNLDVTFAFGTQSVSLRSDYSEIWDAGDAYRDDQALKMLDAFDQYVAKLASHDEMQDVLRTVVNILITENRLAVLWRRLLLLGGRFPERIGKELRSLVLAIPILTGNDTSKPSGEFLRTNFSRFESDEKRRLEETLLSIPEHFASEKREAAEHVRNRLLGCLDCNDLVTEQARSLLQNLKAASGVPGNAPSVHFEYSRRPYGEEEYLAGVGVPVAADQNRRIRELEKPVQEFVQSANDSVESIQTILPPLTALYHALKKADVDGVHPKQRDHAWDDLAAACGRIAGSDYFSCDASIGPLVKDILLEVSRNPDPVHDPDDDPQFDENLAWVSPSPRCTAARGIIRFAGHCNCLSRDIVSALKRLSADPVPAVRYEIVRCLPNLYGSDQKLMWSILDQRCRRDSSCGVLQAAVGQALRTLLGVDVDRVVSLTKAVFRRVRGGPGADKVVEFCVHLLTDSYIWSNHTDSQKVVFRIACHPHAVNARAVVSRLREPITYGSVDTPQASDEAVRKRTVDLILRLLNSARTGVSQLEAEEGKVTGEAEKVSHASLLSLIDYIAREVYFASGMFDGGTVSLSRDEKKRFYLETIPIFDVLTQPALPSTAHHVVETLMGFIPFDPHGVFLCISHTVQAAQKYGFQYDSMAADLIVNLVERYLAEYQSLFRDHNDCRSALIDMLDIFVSWPRAHRLAYRLEEIFR